MRIFVWILILNIQFMFISCSSTKIHTYELKVSKENKESIIDAKIYYGYGKLFSAINYSDSAKINDEGIFKKSFIIEQNEEIENKAFLSELKYLLICKNYYPYAGELTCSFGSENKFYLATNPNSEIVSKNIILNEIKHFYNIIINTDNDTTKSKIRIIFKENSKKVKTDSIITNGEEISIATLPICEVSSNNYIANSELDIYITSLGYKPINDKVYNKYSAKISEFNDEHCIKNLKYKLEQFNHRHNILVKDQHGIPVKNALISYVKSNGVSNEGPFIDSTDKNGMLSTFVNPVFEDWSVNKLKYPTEIKYKISKFGYNDISGKSTSLYGDIDFIDSESKTIAETLQKKDINEIQKTIWGKTYRGVYIEYIPNFDGFLELLFLISSVTDTTNRVDNSPDYMHQEGLKFGIDIIEVFPHYGDLWSKYLDSILPDKMALFQYHKSIRIFKEIFPDKPESSLYLACALLVVKQIETDLGIDSSNDKLVKIEELLLNSNKLFKFNNIFALCKLVEIELDLKKYDEAIEHLNKCKELSYEDSYSDYLFGIYYTKKEDYYKSIDYFKNAITNKDNLKQSIYLDLMIFELFLTYEKLSDYTGCLKALSIYSNLLNLDYYKNKSILLKGICYEKLEDYKNARILYNQFWKLDVENNIGLLGIVRINIIEKKFQDALKVLGKLENDYPDDFWIYYYKSLCFYNLKNCKKAYESYITADNYITDNIDVTNWNDLKMSIKVMCNPELAVSGYVSRYYYCEQGGYYDNSCVRFVDIRFNNKSTINLKNILLEIVIKNENNNIVYQEKFKVSVSIGINVVKDYKIKLSNNVSSYGVDDAGDLIYNINILKVE